MLKEIYDMKGFNIFKLLLVFSLAAVWACSDSDSGGSTASPSKLVYVTNTSTADVAVFDSDALELVGLFDFKVTSEYGERPITNSGNPDNSQSHFLSITHDEKYLWIGEASSSGGNGFVQVIDVDTQEKLGSWNVGAGVGFYISRDGKYVFSATNNGSTSGNINVFDVAKREYLGTIKHGSNPHVYDSTPDGKILWTSRNVNNGAELVGYALTDIDKLPTSTEITPEGFPLKIIQITPRVIDLLAYLKTQSDLRGDQSLSLHALTVYTPNPRYVIVGANSVYIDKNDTDRGGAGDIIVDTDTGNVVARIPGRPHNYELSPDFKYLLSGESNQPNCDEAHYLHELAPELGIEIDDDVSRLIRFVDISELKKENPDFTKINTTDFIDIGIWGFGGVSHQKYSYDGKYIFITTTKSGVTPNGRLLVVDANDLHTLVKELPTAGGSPHALAVPGLDR
jgi:hypothetical protein